MKEEQKEQEGVYLDFCQWLETVKNDGLPVGTPTCFSQRETRVFDLGSHTVGLGYARKRRLPSFPGLPGIR